MGQELWLIVERMRWRHEWICTRKVVKRAFLVPVASFTWKEWNMVPRDPAELYDSFAAGAFTRPTSPLKSRTLMPCG